MATKIAEVLQVFLDYLVGKTDLELDNNTFKQFPNSLKKKRNTSMCSLMLLLTE
jgi:hypothetical protein